MMQTSKVRINTATIEEITTLYGIGPKLAKRIVEYREQNGFFSSPEDLAKVDGLSNELAITLSPYIDWTILSTEDKAMIFQRLFFMFIPFLCIAIPIVPLTLSGLLQDIQLFLQSGEIELYRISERFILILLFLSMTLLAIFIIRRPFVPQKWWTQYQIYKLSTLSLLLAMLLTIPRSIYQIYEETINYYVKAWAVVGIIIAVLILVIVPLINFSYRRFGIQNINFIFVLADLLFISLVLLSTIATIVVPMPEEPVFPFASATISLFAFAEIWRRLKNKQSVIGYLLPKLLLVSENSFESIDDMTSFEEKLKTNFYRDQTHPMSVIVRFLGISAATIIGVIIAWAIERLLNQLFPM